MTSDFPELEAFEDWLVKNSPYMRVVEPAEKQRLMSAFFLGIEWSRKNESAWYDVYGEFHLGSEPVGVMDWFSSHKQSGQKPEVLNGASNS